MTSWCPAACAARSPTWAAHPPAVGVIGRARAEVVPGTTPVNRQMDRFGAGDHGDLSTLLVDRHVALEVGGVTEQLVIVEDLELLAHLMAAGHHVEQLADVVSVRRFHDTNVSAAEDDPEASLLALMRRHLQRSREPS